jgi:hypothetical protein
VLVLDLIGTMRLNSGRKELVSLSWNMKLKLELSRLKRRRVVCSLVTRVKELGSRINELKKDMK